MTPAPVPSAPLLDLSGRVALVTGGTKGIGEAIVRHLGAAGARVVAVSRSAPTALDPADKDGGIGTLGADVSRQAEVERMVAAVVERHRALDVLVNCAGTAKRAPALEQAEADWEYMLQLNLRGTAWACRAVAPVMARAGRGRIVNITSIGARFAIASPVSMPAAIDPSSSTAIAGCTLRRSAARRRR